MSKAISEFRKQYLIAFGTITVNMNHLEQWTRAYVARLMNSDIEFVLKCYPTEQYGKLLAILDLTFHHTISDTNTREEFSRIFDKLSSIHQKRNTFIHSEWLFADDDSFVVRTKPLKYPRLDRQSNPPISDLNQLADDIASVIIEMHMFIDKINLTKR
jgi:hypothetical protein